MQKWADGWVRCIVLMAGLPRGGKRMAETGNASLGDDLAAVIIGQ